MKKENKSPIYSRLDYDSAVLIKKNLLMMQMSLLNISKIMGDFKKLRAKESSFNLEVRDSAGGAKKKLNEIITSFPKTKSLRTLTKSSPEKKEEKPQKKDRPAKKSVEQELLEIKERLQKISF
jgi:hypothetical protein